MNFLIKWKIIRLPNMVKKMQLEKGDSLTKGYTSKLWDFTCIIVTQNNL
ncbi:hypothetical protein Goshw_002554 [Gossypium schwendimanii]|uniref:Uncharacterized protein n=1 Tax=Gossypium schwendimanii TaxID=34291 RepID=A0A7J9LJX7_GOSSC|nr:hypothetical protein [Gossypium schwendimanii]